MISEESSKVIHLSGFYCTTKKLRACAIVTSFVLRLPLILVAGAHSRLRLRVGEPQVGVAEAGGHAPNGHDGRTVSEAHIWRESLPFCRQCGFTLRRVRCVLVRSCQLEDRQLPDSLCQILADPRVIKLGVGIHVRREIMYYVCSLSHLVTDLDKER